MYRRPITFTDYDGNQVTENFEFNLSKAELVEMEAEYPGGMQAMIQRITKERDGKAIVSVIKDIILRSYGERSLDGRRFVRNEDMREKFSQTDAYSELFMELAMNPDKTAEFINNIIPKIPDAPKPVE